jgi:hypothetical protein
MSLLRIPLAQLKSVRRLLTLPNVSKVVDNLPQEQRKRFAHEIVDVFLPGFQCYYY